MENQNKLQMYIETIKITIILCWIFLGCFWMIKLFGGNWFEIMVSNENFIKFSDLIQNTWLKCVVSFFTIGIAKYLTIGAVCQKLTFKGKHLLFVLCSIISIWAVVNFVPNDIIRMIYPYEIIMMFAILYQKKWRRLYGVLAIALEFLFSTISMLVRNVPINITQNYLVIAILIIDMYIMTTLYYLYANLIRLKKEK